MKKRTLTDRVIEYMEELEDVGTDVANTSNSKLVLGYYHSLGMSMDITVSQWLTALAERNYPTYESVVRSIRKARELNPRWRRQKKQELIDEAREEIGYDGNHLQDIYGYSGRP